MQWRFSFHYFTFHKVLSPRIYSNIIGLKYNISEKKELCLNATQFLNLLFHFTKPK